MATLNKTKARMSSAKSTQKVIKAMELVASSKIKAARESALGIEFYHQTTIEAINSLFSYNDISKLINVKGAKEKTLFVIFTSDMGLCGAYNNNVLKEFTKKHATNVDFEAIVVGSKGISKLNYEGIEIYKQYHENTFKTDYDLALEISRNVLELFTTGMINNVEIILTKFKNPIVQEVEVLDLFNLDNIVKKEGLVAGVEIEGDEDGAIFTQLIEMYITSQVYYALLNSKASEYAMRRTSMETANKNSLELIDKLNLEINRLRQSIITQEIAEIVGGSEALKAKN